MLYFVSSSPPPYPPRPPRPAPPCPRSRRPPPPPPPTTSPPPPPPSPTVIIKRFINISCIVSTIRVPFLYNSSILMFTLIRLSST